DEGCLIGPGGDEKPSERIIRLSDQVRDVGSRIAIETRPARCETGPGPHGTVATDNAARTDGGGRSDRIDGFGLPNFVGQQLDIGAVASCRGHAGTADDGSGVGPATGEPLPAEADAETVLSGRRRKDDLSGKP